MLIDDWSNRAKAEAFVCASRKLVTAIIQRTDRDQDGILYQVLIDIPEDWHVEEADAHHVIWRRYVEFSTRNRRLFFHAALDQQEVADQVRSWLQWKPQP